MTDFKRGMREVDGGNFQAGEWYFYIPEDDTCEVFYRGQPKTVATNIKQAVNWAKRNWRRIERENSWRPEIQLTITAGSLLRQDIRIIRRRMNGMLEMAAAGVKIDPARLATLKAMLASRVEKLRYLGEPET